MLAILFRDGKEVKRLEWRTERDGPPLFIRVPHHRHEPYDPNGDPTKLIDMFQEVLQACGPACRNCSCVAYHSINSPDLASLLRGKESATDWRFQAQYV